MSATRKLIKTESLPMLLPIGFKGAQTFFQDDQYIRDKKLMSLSVTPGLGQNYTDGKSIADYNTLLNAYVTLESYSGVQFMRKKPLMQLISIVLPGSTDSYENFNFNFIGQRVNWVKSYVEFAPNIVYKDDQYILFDVQFTELKQSTLITELGVGFNEKS